MSFHVRRAPLVALSLLLALACAAQRPGAGRGVAAPPAQIRLLTINDFHGQLPPGKKLGGRPVGSAGVLGAWLLSARLEGHTVLVSGGDLVGASPPESALLQDEPAISFLNRFAGPACRAAGGEDPRDVPADWPMPETEPRFRPWLAPDCDVVGVVGNHELDEGRGELLRLLTGGNHPRGPFLEKRWYGARWPTLAANVIDEATGRPFLPPFVVKRVDGVKVGFIGAVTRATGAGLVAPSGIAGLEFQDEAEAVNRWVRVLKERGVRAIVVVLHEGGEQPPYAGMTRDGSAVEGRIVDVVARLDPEVDVVVAGHTHAFLNARLPAMGGKEVLVVEAFSAGTAFGRIDLEVDRSTGDVVSARAAVQTAWADEGPGKAPDRESLALQEAAAARVGPKATRQVADLAVELTRTQSEGGESAVGDLVADAQRSAAPGARIAFTNRGGLRADLPAGATTWGALFAVQPFGNDLVTMTLGGEELVALLESQFGPGRQEVLQVSGLTYGWSASAPVGKKVRDVRVGGAPLDLAGRYRVVVNGFLASGGDGFAVLKGGADRARGGNDLEALVAYLSSLPQPVGAPEEGRIRALP
jgi:5'-nucleotidase